MTDKRWDLHIKRFRDLTGHTVAGREYVHLLESSRARWEETVDVDSLARTDALVLRRHGGSDYEVLVTYSERADEPTFEFRLGRSVASSGPVTAGDFCRVENGPLLMDAFLLQIAEPAE